MSSPAFQNAWVLTGPTGSGKSEYALRLAERWNAEIIAMDSMTLYRGMDVGTAKPSENDRRRVVHHLIDILHPWESANVAWWRERAIECCREIESRGKRVLFVGGTPLYLKALLSGLFEGPPANPEIRQRLEILAANEGQEALHRQLMVIDPMTAQRLHPHDLKRVVRAIEVWEMTGRPISCWQQQWQEATLGHPAVAVCRWIDRPRRELYSRINYRVEKMLESGWLDEARRLRDLHLPMSREASKAVGYPEIFAYLDGKMGLPEATAKIQMRCRQFAKRQMTWFRNLAECRQLPISGDQFPSPELWPDFA